MTNKKQGKTIPLTYRIGASLANNLGPQVWMLTLFPGASQFMVRLPATAGKTSSTASVQQPVIDKLY